MHEYRTDGTRIYAVGHHIAVASGVTTQFAARIVTALNLLEQVEHAQVTKYRVGGDNSREVEFKSGGSDGWTSIASCYNRAWALSISRLLTEDSVRKQGYQGVALDAGDTSANEQLRLKSLVQRMSTNEGEIRNLQRRFSKLESHLTRFEDRLNRIEEVKIEDLEARADVAVGKALSARMSRLLDE